MNRVAVSIILSLVGSLSLVTACSTAADDQSPTVTPQIAIVGELPTFAPSTPRPTATASPTPLPSRTPIPTAREVSVSRISNDINPALVTPIALGVTLPDLTVTDIDGNAINLLDAGRPMILNFWSVGCGSCFYEFPLLQQFYAHHGAENLAVVGINIADFPEETRVIADQLGIEFPMVVDQNAEFFATYFNGAVVPTTIFIDANGRVARVAIGPIDAYNIDQQLQDMGLAAYEP